MVLRDYQRKVVNELEQYILDRKGNPCVIAPTGCHGRGTEILMADGSIKLVEDILVGDKVMGGDGTERTVLNLHHGNDMMYKVAPIKGEPFIVNGGHILSLISTPDGKKNGSIGTEVDNISVYEYLGKSNYYKHTHKLYRGVVDEFKTEKKSLPIPSYVLGLLLGDGCITHGCIGYTNPDIETYKDLYTWSDSIGCEIKLQFNSTDCPTLSIKGKERFTRGKSTCNSALRELNLFGKDSATKFIPHEYKTASMDDRLELLAGLMDTDGGLSQNGYDYVTKSKKLADDIVFVCKSVGLAAYKSECTKSCQTGFTGTYYRICISGDTYRIPCRVTRKKATPRLQKKRVNVTGFEVSKVGYGEYFGFECDGDHLYMMGDFTVTHNSGKSVLIATFIDELVSAFPGTRVLILTHQKELIEQDMAKLRLVSNLDMGVYSASLGDKDDSHDITFASIQSIYKRDDLRYDCVIVDECHMINMEDEGMYRTFLSSATNVVIGFTATPYRLGQGALVSEGSLFTDYIECAGILELQNMGYLSRLSTKRPVTRISVDGVGKAMGEFKKGELQAKVNVFTTNEAVVDETIRLAEEGNRRHCLVFCTGVEHAKEIARMFEEKGFHSVCVEGSMSKTEREAALEEFTSGRARVITNYGVLTTGFDYPAIDCIIMLRPTLSPGLYLQMLGRGLRISEGKNDCIVYDFAGNIDRHGPISSVRPPSKKGTNGDGVPPMKTCPECLSVIASSTMVCPDCGHEFPVHSPMWHLFTGEVNGDEVTSHLIDSWTWVRGTGRNPPYNERFEVTFKTLDGNILKEYVVFDERMKPFVRKMNVNKIFKYCSEFGLKFSDYINVDEPVDSPYRLDWAGVAMDIANAGPPAVVFTRPNQKNPKYTDIVGIMSEETLINDQNLEAAEEQLMKNRYGS